jgi:DNA repair exonuclease SbcCD ATPase subunit
MSSLNNQKLIYLDKEINNWKEKYNSSVKEAKSKEDNFTKEISSLKEQIKKLQNEKNKRENINTEQFNMNINNLMNYFKENLKAQNEENKNMIEKMMKEKKNAEADNELFKNYNELIKKNSELKIEINSKENQIKNLEEQQAKLNIYKEICDHSKNFQCVHCENLYVYDQFKEHYNKCNGTPNNMRSKANNNYNDENKFILNPEKLKIKILKGTLKNDELGKPYLEYIIDINYNTQNWRINKRFNQFANLYKTIKSSFKGFIHMPPSSNIFVNFGGNFNGSFHENKIQQLERFIKDLAEIEVVSSSKVFTKFLEFDHYFEEENDMILYNGVETVWVTDNITVANYFFSSNIPDSVG